MPLILAIEPNRRQASRIRALAPGLVDAEFLIADSTERGVAALDGRVPDLILTPPLLSPKDDAALRELNGGEGVGTAGLHVHTLMIPVLASVERPPGSRPGILSRLRRAKPRDGAAEGCDPAVFAAQIVEYLDRAAAERRALEIDREPEIDREIGAVSTDIGSEIALMPVSEVAVVPEAAVVPEVEIASTLEFEPTTEPAPAAEPDIDLPVTLEITDDAWEEVTIDDDEYAGPIVLTSELIDLQAFVEELDASSHVAVAADAPFDSEAPELEATELEPDPPALPRLAAAHPLSARPAWPPLEGLLAEEAIIDDFAAAGEDVPDGLGEFVPDIAEDEPAEGEADGDPWTALPPVRHGAWPQLQGVLVADPAATGAAARPIEDEWGFFDPERCGFRALLAKLDEITK